MALQNNINDPKGILIMNSTQLIIPHNVFQQQHPRNIFNKQNNIKNVKTESNQNLMMAPTDSLVVVCFIN